MSFHLLLVELVDEGLIAARQILETDTHPPSRNFEIGADVAGYNLTRQLDLLMRRCDLDAQLEQRPNLGRLIGRHEDPPARQVRHEEACHLPEILETNHE
jgi:hypothetical protein